MPIVPLPVFEEEADAKKRGLTDEEIIQYEGMRPPETVVVRYGQMRQIGEFPCRLETVPGCGTKFVVRTSRGIEIGEMLTTTCSNGGCGSSITRKQMLEYIEVSGGEKYPFSTKGRILRIATPTDLAENVGIQKTANDKLKQTRQAVKECSLEMTIVSVEPILSQDHITIYYMSEDRVDFREIVRDLAKEFSARIEMRQVGARDEARLTGDYERCGEHCCCRQFLKILKPVPMRAAKMQKATLDPLKISGRCGRLMCCLRYEDESYVELKKKLPHRKSRVGTPHGPGIVWDSQILTQLVRVRLEHDNTMVAVPVEELSDPETCPRPWEEIERVSSTSRGNERDGKSKEGRKRNRDSSSKRGGDRKQTRDKVVPSSDDSGSGTEGKSKRRRRRSSRSRSGSPESSSPATTTESSNDVASSGESSSTEAPRKKRRRRRGGRGNKDRNQSEQTQSQGDSTTSPKGEGPQPTASGPSTDGDGKPKKKKRRRGRRGGRNRKRGEGGGGGDNKPSSSGPPSSDS